MKKKIYIAGKVTGESIAECTMKFGVVQKQLEAMGFEVVNPLATVGRWDISWEDAMKLCITALMGCDGMVLLPDWHQSSGATIERQLAEDLCFTICNSDKQGLKVLERNLL
jgi:hypothetical protein